MSRYGLVMVLLAGLASQKGLEAQGPAPFRLANFLPAFDDKNGDADKEKNGRDDDKNGAEPKKCKRPSTIFDWAIGPNVEPDDNEDGVKKLSTDRPDFTLPSSTVGLGKIIVETGYTFGRDRTNDVVQQSHSFPEMLVRVGFLAEWLELQIGQNYVTGSSRDQVTGARARFAGATDLLLGLNFALTEQKGWLPESALQINMTLPTGGRQDDNNRRTVNPGIFYTAYWDVKKDALGLSFTSGLAKRNENADHDFLLYYQTGEILFSVGKKTTVFGEAVALVPHAALDLQPQYFLDTGIIYLIAPNLQFDSYVGMGLNRAAPDFFVGGGMSFRF